MTRDIAIVAILVATTSAVAAQAPSAQSQPKTLGEVARAEEARRKEVKKPSKVYTNDDLKPDFTRPQSPVNPNAAAALAPGVPAGDAAANASPSAPAEGAAPEDEANAKDASYWQGRMAKARADQDRLKMFADSLQSRINALTTDYVNRDNRVERELIEKDRAAAVAELERVKRESTAAQQAITKIEDEARRAGVPPGWLRPQ
jgi:hypothetical protein